MTSEHRKSLLIMTLMLFSITLESIAHAASQALDMYNKWSALSDEELLVKGLGYLSGKASPDSALVCYTIVANRHYDNNGSKEGIRNQISVLYNISYIYSRHYYDYQKSYSYLQQALTLSLESGESHTLPYIYNGFANLYMLNNEMHGNGTMVNEIMSLFSKGYNASVKTKDWQIMIVLVNNMVAMAMKYDCVPLIKDELSGFSRQHIPDSIKMSKYIRLVCEGVDAYGKKNYGKAIDCFDKSTDYVNSSFDGAAHYRAISIYNKALVMMRQGEYDKAIANLTEIENDAVANGAVDVLVDVRQMLKECYEKKGDQTMADHYYVAYLKDRDAMLVGNKLEDVNRMKFLDEINKVNEQIRDMAYKHRMQNMLFYVIVAAAALLAVFLIILGIKNRQLRQRNRMLYDNNVKALADDDKRRKIIRQYEEHMKSMSQCLEGKVSEKEQKYKGSALGQNEKSALIKQIDEVMGNTDEICSGSFSLSRLAELVDSNYHYVSQVLNEEYGKNFNALLSEYRIREACRRLNDTENYGNLTIEAISSSVGFKSRSNFAVIFKRITGLSPSEYQKLSRTQ